MKALCPLGLVLVCCAPALAQAPESPSFARGQALAQRWCAPCHLTRVMDIPGDPPTFYAIAKDRRKTSEDLRRFLAGPHENMPPIALTPC
jgi:mono/diheme cytochrome c family protein